MSRLPVHLSRTLVLGLACAGLSLLASCAGGPDKFKTGGIPDDYRTRHPISLAEVEHSLDVPVAAEDRSFSIGARDVIKGFADSYRGQSSGVVRVDYPRGAPNSAAASRLRGELRSVLRSAGIPATRIVETNYEPRTSGAAPIRLTYVATTAMTTPCGEWPEDLIQDTTQNRNYQNFGCATQNNLAAQIASPMDLVAPRAMSPIDAERRSNIIADWRKTAPVAPAATSTWTGF